VLDDTAPSSSTGRTRLAALFALIPKAKVLPAARTLVAFLHGFVSMELEGAFQLRGDVDEAFAFGVETIVGALAPGR
jgi:hypothetical protein